MTARFPYMPIVIGLLICQAASAAMHATAEFESGATRPVSITFVPPEVDVIKRKIVDSEVQIKEGSELASQLAVDIERSFEAQGYVVRVLTPEEIGADPELQELVLDANRRYKELLGQVRTKLPRQIAKRRYNAGDEMRLLAAKLGVDAIGYADMQIVASAAGASAVSILVGIGSSGSSTMMTVSLIDGQTADIEAFFTPTLFKRGSIAGYDAIMADPAGKLAEITDSALKDLPPPIRADALATATRTSSATSSRCSESNRPRAASLHFCARSRCPVSLESGASGAVASAAQVAPAAVRGDVRGDIVNTQNVDALLREMQRCTERREVALVAIVVRDMAQERLARVADQSSQAVTAEFSSGAQQLRGLQRILAEADAAVEDQAVEVEPVIGPRLEVCARANSRSQQSGRNRSAGWRHRREFRGCASRSSLRGSYGPGRSWRGRSSR